MNLRFINYFQKKIIMKVLAFTLFLALAMSANAAHWAVLVAGSNGFWNYRHQADICHAY